MNELIKAIDLLAKTEKSRAQAIWGNHHSRHEAFAVLREEYDEMSDEEDRVIVNMDAIWSGIKKNATKEELADPINSLIINALSIAAEAVQVAATAYRLKDFEEAGGFVGDWEKENKFF